MRCLFCGHNTRGPWPYCDATCEEDHATAAEIDEIAEQMETAATYELCDEPE